MNRPDWRNLNNYTLSASGPIIKNKTFFFATWDQQIVTVQIPAKSARSDHCARKGIYRYLDGWVSNNANPRQIPLPNMPRRLTRNVVDASGNPVYDYTYTGRCAIWAGQTRLHRHFGMKAYWGS